MPVIMGRKTYDALAGERCRAGLILSLPVTGLGSTERKVKVVDAFSMGSRCRRDGCQEVFVIGGAKIYQQSMPMAIRSI